MAKTKPYLLQWQRQKRLERTGSPEPMTFHERAVHAINIRWARYREAAAKQRKRPK